MHGTTAEDVHFHEVGALDSIADVVGVCAALADLGVGTVSAGPVAVGSGRTRVGHGDIGIPVPAVAELSTGWRVRAGGPGELATPTGMALVVTLGQQCEDLPDLLVAATGVGAGTRDTPGRANVTRVVLGRPVPAADPAGAAAGEAEVLLEANVDDLDPRLWPGVLAALLAAGASDAWLVPALMKKGRPAHVLSVLAPVPDAARLREVVLASTPTFGVRQHPVSKYALPRGWADVQVDGVPVAVKVAHRDGTVLQATPELEEVLAAAERLGRAPAAVLAAAGRAAGQAGLLPGAPTPVELRSVRPRPTPPAGSGEQVVEPTDGGRLGLVHGPEGV